MERKLNKFPQNCRHFLPIEIWENILKILVYHPRTIVTASSVCSEWRHLVTAICKTYCKNFLNKRLIEELSEINVSHRYFIKSKENENIDWIKVYWMYHETFINVGTEKNIIPLQLESVTSLTSNDSYMILTTYNKINDRTELIVLDSDDFPFMEDFVLEKSIESLLKNLSNLRKIQVEGKVYQTCFLHIPSPILIMVTSFDMRATCLRENHNEKSHLQVLFTNPRLAGDEKISCCGSHLLVIDYENSDSLLLYKATGIEKEALQMILLHRIQFFDTPYQFVLSKSMNVPDDKIDDVVLCAQSALKKDLRYPNPTLFFKDFVFSSTLISRNLLWYWHMDRGRDYWIIGDLSRNITNKYNNSSGDIPCIRLYQVHIGHETGFTVTTVEFKRGILLCGTSEGHVLGYKLKKNLNDSSGNNFEDWTKHPLFLIEDVISGTISRLGSLYTPIGLLVAAVNEKGSCSISYIPSEII